MYEQAYIFLANDHYILSDLWIDCYMLVFVFFSIATTNLICGREIVILKKNQWGALCNEESVYENQFEGGGSKIAEMYRLNYNML